MKVTGVNVKVLPFDSSSADTSVNYSHDEMHRTGQKNDPFLSTVMRSLKELDKGATIIIKPLLDFDSDYESNWYLVSHTAQHEIVDLLIEGKRIQVIKILRKETGMDLKKSKAMMDSLWLCDKVKEIIQWKNCV
jgi:hypothetical protein